MPTAIAITPDGKTAYVANEGSNTVTPITVATGTAGTPITVGSTPDAIAITPNGQTAYVANEGSRTVTPITVATGTAGTPIPVGNAPVAIAITPDGQTAYVVNTSSDSVTPITVATGTAGTPITVGLAPEGIAITPDGTTAYVVSNSASTDTPITIPITVASNTAGTPIPIGSYPDDMPWDIAITFGPVTTGSGSSGSTGSGPVVETANGSQANVTFGVTGGDRTATLAGAIAFPAVDASHSNVDATVQSASVQVNDLSASDAGWDVTLVASDLAGANGGTITAGNMSVTGYGALASISGATTNIQTGTPGSIGSPTALLSASPGSGVGDYTQAFNLGLVLPADSLAGSYAGTLTVTIAPPL
jgi:YVTN family beta-propeller protein